MGRKPRAGRALPITRNDLENHIEQLIDMLDALDPDPDLEPQCEDEGAQCEDEGAQCEDEGYRDEDTHVTYAKPLDYFEGQALRKNTLSKLEDIQRRRASAPRL